MKTVSYSGSCGSLQIRQPLADDIRLFDWRFLSHTFHELKKLVIRAPHVREISSDTFDGLKSLEKLHVEFESLEKLPEKLFFPLKRLRLLDLNIESVDTLPIRLLRHNKRLQCLRIVSAIVDFPAATFNGLDNINELEIKTVDFVATISNDSTNKWAKLRKLYLESTVAKNFECFAKIKKLTLASSSDLEIDFLKNYRNLIFLNLKYSLAAVNFAELIVNRNLKVLILRENIVRLEPVANSFFRFEYLTFLDLGQCSLTNLRSIFFGIVCPLLSYLSLSDNLINTPKIGAVQFLNLTYLKKLDLSYNFLINLSNERIFGTLGNLTVLLLNQNRLSGLPMKCFGDLINLRVLDLSKNLLTALDSEWFDGSNSLYALDTLIVGSNHLAGVSKRFLKRFPFLKYLNLSHNYITRLTNGNFKYNCLLRNLNLSTNSLQFLHAKQFCHLKRLEYLNCENNLIRFLNGTTFLGVNRLRALNLNRNPLQQSNIESLVFDRAGVILQYDTLNDPGQHKPYNKHRNNLQRN